MGDTLVAFDRVWKRFRRGERHDSLRDLMPGLVKGAWRRQREALEAGEFWALRDVSFEVRRGEALGIIGPNGAGKSTALKLLTKILKPTDGTCLTRGRVGALIEVAAGFHPDLTGRENIYLQGAIMGMKRAEIQKRFDEIVEFAGVGDFIQTPVKRYSSGMNARLGFSIAAHLNPDVLLIDEVLAVGDAAFQQKCHDRMAAFRDQGAAIVLVSHNLHAVAQLCERALVLRSGESAGPQPVSEALFEYSRDHHADAQPDGRRLASIDVIRRGRVDAQAAAVTPGDPLTFDVRMRLQTPVAHAHVGVVVRDIARNVYVYGITSDSIGLPRIAGQPGDSFSFAFELVANLTRGQYAVEINLFDMERQEHLAVLMPAFQFSVVEQQSYGGVANLFLRGSAVPTEPDAHHLIPA